MQVVDARDLAVWIVDSCEARRTGVFDGIGPAQPMADLLADAAAGVDHDVPPDVHFTWVDQEFLTAQGVEPWAGPDSVPLWLPRPEYDGLGAHDVAPSLEAGLTIRPLAETVRDTNAWLDSTPAAVVTGISLERERELLNAWSAQPRPTGIVADDAALDRDSREGRLDP